MKRQTMNTISDVFMITAIVWFFVFGIPMAYWRPWQEGALLLIVGAGALLASAGYWEWQASKRWRNAA